MGIDGASATPTRAPHLLAGTAALCMLALVPLALAVYAAAELARYTPVYQPLVCEGQPAEFGPRKVGGGFVNISGTSAVTCHNPNPYDVEMSQAQPGRLLVMPNLESVGYTATQYTMLPAGASQTTETVLVGSLPMELALELLPRNNASFVLELDMQNKAGLSFLGMTFSVTERMNQFCGFTLQFHPQKIGAPACTTSLADLVIPDADASGALRFEADIDAATLASASRIKDAAFGTAIAVFACLWLAMWGCAYAALRRWQRAGALDAAAGAGAGAEAKAAPAQQDPEAGLEAPTAAAATLPTLLQPNVGKPRVVAAGAEKKQDEGTEGAA